MSSTEVKILAGPKLVLDLLHEVNNKKIDQAKELEPIDGGALPTPGTTPAGQDYKMQVSGGKAGRTFTHSTLSGGSKALTSKEIGLFYWNGTTRIWSYRNGQELPILPTVNNLDTLVPGTALDATQGKVLLNKIETIVNYSPTWLPYGIKTDGTINTGDTLQHFDFMPAKPGMRIESFNGDLYRINIYDINQVNIQRTDYVGGSYYVLPNDSRIAYIRASSVSAGSDPNAPNPRTIQTSIGKNQEVANSLNKTNENVAINNSNIQSNRILTLSRQGYIAPNAIVVNFMTYVQNGSLDGTGGLVPSDTRRAIFKMPITFGKAILIKNDVDKTATTKRVVLYNASNTITRTFNQTDQSNFLITPAATEVFLSITLIAPPNESKVNDVSTINVYESLNTNEPIIEFINGLKLAGFDAQIRTSPIYSAKYKLSVIEGYINVTTGKVTSSPGFKYTDYIAVFEGQRIRGKARLYGNSGICGYPTKSDTTFTVLFSPTASVNEFDITIPIGSGVKYMRLATQTSVVPEIELDYSLSYNYELFASVGVSDDLSIQNLLFKGGHVELTNLVSESEKMSSRWFELKDNFDFPSSGVYIGQRNGEAVVSVNGVVKKINLV